MDDKLRLYIADMGMVTPLGPNALATAAAVRAGISAYRLSDHYTLEDEPVTMTAVPKGLIDGIEAEIEEGDRFNARHDRIIKLALFALRAAMARHQATQALPLLLAMPEGDQDNEGLTSLVRNLAGNCNPWITTPMCRTLHGGRAAGIEAIDFAFRYLYELPTPFILTGGSDSYDDPVLLRPYIEADRLLAPGNKDGFAPGEGACFLLLTRHPELAQMRDGHIIALHPPGIASEPGHLGSETPYRGEGLDQAFKQALANYGKGNIHTIYSSMNGENHWAKEYGVAYTRSHTAFLDPVRIEHPADCLGDLGAATAPALIALAAEDLFKRPEVAAHLVYSSSDGAKRGAVVVEKVPVTAHRS